MKYLYTYYHQFYQKQIISYRSIDCLSQTQANTPAKSIWEGTMAKAYSWSSCFQFLFY